MKLEKEAKDRQVKELERIVLLMTNSALATEQETPSRKLKGVMSTYMKNLDLLSDENFKLKTEIANG